ncbi:hypothetical protein B0O99DRAFT_631152 [Bisporella sp. PMI_857]|nr:hypothetical protein B0O99DRAFT_631152 [Bisporella sp. PMI_857]
MNPADVKLLLEEVRKDLCDHETHYYTPILVVYGRKPEQRLRYKLGKRIPSIIHQLGRISDLRFPM